MESESSTTPSKKRFSGPLWKYFTPINPWHAKCYICQQSFSYRSTKTNLRKHLRVRHVEAFNELNALLEQNDLKDGVAEIKYFISIVKTYPCLWDTRVDTYADENLKNEVWESIASQLNTSNGDYHSSFELSDQFKKLTIKYFKNQHCEFSEDLSFLEPLLPKRISKDQPDEDIPIFSQETITDDSTLNITELEYERLLTPPVIGPWSGKNNKSLIWIFFDRLSKGIGNCVLCNSTFSYRTTISNLKSHLKKRHPLHHRMMYPDLMDKSPRGYTNNLIELVKMHPCLWNFNSNGGISEQQEAWTKISTVLDPNEDPAVVVPRLIEKLKDLRSSIVSNLSSTEPLEKQIAEIPMDEIKVKEEIIAESEESDEEMCINEDNLPEMYVPAHLKEESSDIEMPLREEASPNVHIEANSSQNGKKIVDSPMWKYFKRIGPGIAQCCLCNTIRSYKTTLTNLKNHLLLRHYDAYSSLQKNTSTKKKIESDSFVSIEDLIEEVKLHPCLWNNLIEQYQNADIKLEAWKQIAQKLFPTEDQNKMIIEISEKFNQVKNLFFPNATTSEQIVNKIETNDKGRVQVVEKKDLNVSKGRVRKTFRTSPVWRYFKRTKPGVAKCTICNATLSYKATISNLKRHLSVRHNKVPTKTPSMTISQVDSTVVSFTELVKAYPCLWDSRIESYKDEDAKKESWSFIASKLYPGEDESKIIPQLVERFEAHKNHFLSGAVCTAKFFKEMSFLDFLFDETDDEMVPDNDININNEESLDRSLSIENTCAKIKTENDFSNFSGYFKRVSEDCTRCNLCKCVLTIDSNTESLREHMLAKHANELSKLIEPNDLTTEDYTEKDLIEKIKKFPCLWDSRIDSFGDFNVQLEAWNTIASELNPTEDRMQVVTKLSTIFNSIKYQFYSNHRKGIPIPEELLFMTALLKGDQSNAKGDCPRPSTSNRIESHSNLDEVQNTSCSETTPPKDLKYHGQKTSLSETECNLQLQNADGNTLFFLSLVKETKKIPEEMQFKFKTEFLIELNKLIERYKK